MIYEFRYESKSNYYNNLSIIINTNAKKFYAWKQPLFTEKKYASVVNHNNRLLTLVYYKKDIENLIIAFRNDKEYTEV